MIISLLFENPILFFIWIIAVLLALSVHEFAHAWMATRLGDDTPVLAGRLTLNPLVHVDLLGFFMLVFVGFGWGKPVPFNPYMLKNKKWGPALVALAGPVSNLIVFLAFGFIFKLIYDFNPIVAFFNITQGNPVPFLVNGFTFLILTIIMINIMLMSFNLIPIPPLDGSKVLFEFLPSRYHNLMLFLESRGPYLLLGLLILDNLGLPVFSFLFVNLIKIFSKFFALV